MLNTPLNITARIWTRKPWSRLLEGGRHALTGAGFAIRPKLAGPATLPEECPVKVLKVPHTILCAGNQTQEPAGLLRQEGYRVVCVENGQRAWNRLVSAPFDLLLVPLGLRGLDGIRLAERLRRLWISAPILFLSEIGNPFTTLDQARLGIAGVLALGCPSHVLLAAVFAALRSPAREWGMQRRHQNN